MKRKWSDSLSSNIKPESNLWRSFAGGSFSHRGDAWRLFLQLLLQGKPFTWSRAGFIPQETSAASEAKEEEGKSLSRPDGAAHLCRSLSSGSFQESLTASGDTHLPTVSQEDGAAALQGCSIYTHSDEWKLPDSSSVTHISKQHQQLFILVPGAASASSPVSAATTSGWRRCSFYQKVIKVTFTPRINVDKRNRSSTTQQPWSVSALSPVQQTHLNLRWKRRQILWLQTFSQAEKNKEKVTYKH